MTALVGSPFALGRSPLFDVLASSRRVLSAGAGGGFDVFGAVPLKVALEAEGTPVELANLSFTDLGLSEAEQVHEAWWRVDAHSPGLESRVGAWWHPLLTSVPFPSTTPTEPLQTASGLAGSQLNRFGAPTRNSGGNPHGSAPSCDSIAGFLERHPQA